MSEERVHSKKIGSGPPLVMLHGWGQSYQDLVPLAELMAQHACVHLLSLPGFGDTPAPESAWGSADYADWVVSYLDRESLSRVSLLGHSFGGRVSLRIAAAYPQRVERLILVGSHGLKRHRSLAGRAKIFVIPRLGRGLKWFDRFSGLKFFESWFVPRFGSRDYLAAGALRGTLVKLVNEDQSELLPKILAPTLLLWGAKDSETPLEMGRRMAGLIPTSELIVMPNCGHFPHADIGAHLCAFYITDFLKRGRR